MSLASIEIEGEDFGTMELPAEQLARGKWVDPLGKAFFCTKCGRVWAKITVPERRYFIWSLSCEACGNSHSLEVAGSVWLLWEKEYNDALPRKVLDREMRLLLKEAA